MSGINPEIQPQPRLDTSTRGHQRAWSELISEADERFGHQLVAPALVPSAPGALWAERTFLSAHLPPSLQFSAGRAVYPYGGRRTGYVALATAEAIHAVRAQEQFALGEDTDDPQVGDIRIEVLEPLRRLRITLEQPGVPLALDLIYEARTPVVPTDRNLIEVRGQVLADYMNFYQSGWYSGTIVLHGCEHRVERVLGFRDRGWGMRKHEGAPRRGLVLFGAHELPDFALWYLLYESASGKRAFTNGWLAGPSGILDTITGIEHDLDLDDRRLCQGGRLLLSCSSGRERKLEFEVDARMHLAACGYHEDPDWPPLGYRRYETSRAATLQQLNGQNDNGGACVLDGVEGHGFIETGIGVHPKYRPIREDRDE